jgi:hypothetical protein
MKYQHTDLLIACEPLQATVALWLNLTYSAPWLRNPISRSTITQEFRLVRSSAAGSPGVQRSCSFLHSNCDMSLCLPSSSRTSTGCRAASQQGNLYFRVASPTPQHRCCVPRAPGKGISWAAHEAEASAVCHGQTHVQWNDISLLHHTTGHRSTRAHHLHQLSINQHAPGARRAGDSVTKSY